MNDILAALDRFVSGDSSVAAANRLKDLLAESFPEDPCVRRLVVELAGYRQGDYPEKRERVRAARPYLANAIWARPPPGPLFWGPRPPVPHMTQVIPRSAPSFVETARKSTGT